MRRLVAWIARFAVALLFRRVEVAGIERLPRRDRPVLLVANHFNGFVDPVLIATALGRLPRFIAKAGLRKIPSRGWCCAAPGWCSCTGGSDSRAGADRATRTPSSTATAPSPSATSSPSSPRAPPTTEPRSTRSRPARARIALGARAAGADDLAIVPVGLTFPDKVALRSSALVQFGLPIELDVVAPGAVGADDADAVRQLTAVIDRGIRAVSPDFPDVETALALDQAAQVALSSRDDPDPSLEARADLARRLGRATPEEQAAVRRDVGRYLTTLRGLRLTDADVIAPDQPARLLRSAFWIAVLVILLGGLVAATALVNVWPAALVILVSLLVKTPVSKGTARVLVGLIAFPTAWITAGVLAADGAAPRSSLVVVTAAVGALAAIWMVERAIALAVDAAALAGAARAHRHGRPGRDGARRRGRHGPRGRPAPA